jgi:CheY-like chemotaxis protein
VVDDHAAVRRGLERLLASTGDLEYVGGADSGAAAVDLAAERCPDVVVMDLSMPGVDGVEATRRIRARRPETNVLVLTAVAEPERLAAAVQAGAVGALTKDTDASSLLAASGTRRVARRPRPEAPADRLTRTGRTARYRSRVVACRRGAAGRRRPLLPGSAALLPRCAAAAVRIAPGVAAVTARKSGFARSDGRVESAAWDTGSARSTSSARGTASARCVRRSASPPSA